jgi:hypothetical protein
MVAGNSLRLPGPDPGSKGRLEKRAESGHWKNTPITGFVSPLFQVMYDGFSKKYDRCFSNHPYIVFL